MTPARGRAVSPFDLDEIESSPRAGAGTEDNAARPAQEGPAHSAQEISARPAQKASSRPSEANAGGVDQTGATNAISAASAISTLRRLRPYAGNLLLGLAVLAALAGGFTWLAVRPQPRRIEVVIPAPAPVVVQIGGAVISPGVYTLPAGSRVTDAIAAAGGLAPSADSASLNQAAKVADGSRMDIPFARAAPLTAGGSAGSVQGQQSGGAAATAIDLNTATQAQIESLPGIGPTLAQAIIEFRSKNGLITRVDQLLAVERIGPKTIDAIRPFVTQP